MTRRSSRQDGTAVSLFPFLAVLVCTMGSLILLLVVMVQHARTDVSVVEPLVPSEDAAVDAAVSESPDSAVPASPPTDEPDGSPSQQVADAQQLAADGARDAAERAAQRDRIEQLKIEREETLWRIEVMKQSREELTQQLADRRLQLSHIEDHARRLEDDLKVLSEQLARIEQGTLLQTQEKDDLEERLEQTRLQLAAAAAEVDALEREIAARPKAYAIIPYEGRNGTRRRPLYVECTGDEVIIQPEGIALAAEDFRRPLSAGNPLAAALRAQREYLAAAGGLHGANGDEPYPLLIVRPDGARSYAAAREALKSWDAEFGYELVAEDTQLAFPRPDPRLRALLERTVEQSRRRRAQMLAVSRQRGEGSQLALRASNSGGGFVVERVEGTSSGGAVVNPMTPQREAERMTNRGGSPAAGTASGEGYARHGTRHDTINTGREESGAGGAGGGTRGSGPAYANGESPQATPGNAASRYAASRYGNDSRYRAASSSSHAARHPPLTRPSEDGFGRRPNDASPPNATHGGERGATHREAYGRTGRGSASQQSSGVGGGPGGPQSGAVQVGSAPGIGDGNHRRGANWALPQATATATGVTRPIAVLCMEDRLVLLPERDTDQQAEEVLLTGSTADAIDPFVSVVSQRIEQWGIAGPRMYWKPTLLVEVMPGAHRRFGDLQRLLRGSGIEVRENSASTSQP